MVPALVWWAGGTVLAVLGGLRVRAVIVKDRAAAAAEAAPAAATRVSPQQAAAVTPAQVSQAAASVGLTPAQLSEAAQKAGTTPQVIVAQSQQTGISVQQAIDMGAAAADRLVAEAIAQDASLQAQINPIPETTLDSGTANMAQIRTKDPPPAGDLIVRAGPSASSPQIGGAEKDGVVFILQPDDGSGFTKVSWPGGSRLPAAEGFVHTSALDTSFNGDGAPPDVAEAHGRDFR